MIWISSLIHQKLFKYITIVVIVLMVSFPVYTQTFKEPICMPETHEPIWVVTQLYGRVIKFKWPKGKAFCHASQKQQGPQGEIGLLEFIPKEETLQNWLHKLDIYVFYNSLKPNLETFRERLISRCSTATFSVLQNTEDTLEFMQACGSYNDKSTNNKELGELNNVVIKMSGGNAYLFGFSKRIKPFDASNYKFKAPDLEWNQFLNSIEILIPPASQIK